MATTFKTLTPKDIVSTRNLLHEAIPLTGAIVSGTYAGENVENFSHGMFQAVYDYPYLSSSANHVLDLTAGYSSNSALSNSAHTQNTKKINVYNEMAQVLVGFDENNTIRRFDEDGDFVSTATKVDDAYFINFARLLTKDEIKKGSFTLSLGASASYAGIRSIPQLENTESYMLQVRSLLPQRLMALDMPLQAFCIIRLELLLCRLRCLVAF